MVEGGVGKYGNREVRRYGSMELENGIHHPLPISLFPYFSNFLFIRLLHLLFHGCTNVHVASL